MAGGWTDKRPRVLIALWVVVSGALQCESAALGWLPPVMAAVGAAEEVPPTLAVPPETIEAPPAPTPTPATPRGDGGIEFVLLLACILIIGGVAYLIYRMHQSQTSYDRLATDLDTIPSRVIKPLKDASDELQRAVVADKTRTTEARQVEEQRRQQLEKLVRAVGETLVAVRKQVEGIAASLASASALPEQNSAELEQLNVALAARDKEIFKLQSRISKLTADLDAAAVAHESIQQSMHDDGEKKLAAVSAFVLARVRERLATARQGMSSSSSLDGLSRATVARAENLRRWVPEAMKLAESEPGLDEFRHALETFMASLEDGDYRCFMSQGAQVSAAESLARLAERVEIDGPSLDPTLLLEIDRERENLMANAAALGQDTPLPDLEQVWNHIENELLDVLDTFYIACFEKKAGLGATTKMAGILQPLGIKAIDSRPNEPQEPEYHEVAGNDELIAGAVEGGIARLVRPGYVRRDGSRIRRATVTTYARRDY